MQASIGFGCRAAEGVGRRKRTQRARFTGTLHETASRSGRTAAAAGSAAQSLPRRAKAHAEHALFALTLGSIGYVWLGALLAEALHGL